MKPKVIAISGHAAVGKTSISEALVRRIPNSVRLETECCIFPLAKRQSRNVSGCSINAHELSLFKTYIEDLISGRTISFREYDWRTRSRSGPILSKTLARGGTLVLDGTISCHPEIAEYCDEVVFLKPAVYEDWMAFAVERDIRERWRERSLATRENEAKYLDAAAIEHVFSTSISHTVLVKVPLISDSVHDLRFSAQTFSAGRAEP